MQLNQLELSYTPEQDRLILRIGTTTDETVQLFFTRRFIIVFWPVLQQAIESISSNHIAEATNEEVSIKPAGTGSLSHSDEDYAPSKELLAGGEAVLVTSFGLNYKSKGITEFSFTGIDGLVVTLNLNQGLIDSLSELIEQILPKIEWDIDLDSLEIQTPQEETRVIH